MNSPYDPDLLELLINTARQQQTLVAEALSRCCELKETSDKRLQFISDYHVCSNKAFTYFRHLQQLIQELLQRYEDAKEKLVQLEKKHEFTEFELVQQKEQCAKLQRELVEVEVEAARRIEETTLQFDTLYAEKQAEVQYYAKQCEKVSRQCQQLQLDAKLVKRCRSSDLRETSNTFVEALKVIWQMTSNPSQVQSVLDSSSELIQLLDAELDSILMCCSLTIPTKFQAERLSPADLSTVLSILGILVNISASPYGKQALLKEENKPTIQHIVNAFYIIPFLPAKRQSEPFRQKPTSRHKPTSTRKICEISDIKELLLCFCSNLVTEKLGAIALLEFGIVSATINLITQETPQEVRQYGVLIFRNALERCQSTNSFQAMEPAEWVKLCPDYLQIPKLLSIVKQDFEIDPPTLESISKLQPAFNYEE